MCHSQSPVLVNKCVQLLKFAPCFESDLVPRYTTTADWLIICKVLRQVPEQINFRPFTYHFNKNSIYQTLNGSVQHIIGRQHTLDTNNSPTTWSWNGSKNAFQGSWWIFQLLHCRILHYLCHVCWQIKLANIQYSDSSMQDLQKTVLQRDSVTLLSQGAVKDVQRDEAVPWG